MRKSFSPELGHAQPHFIAGSHVPGLHPRHQHRKSESEGDENKVEHAGDGELPSAEQHYIHIHWMASCNWKLMNKIFGQSKRGKV